MADLFCQPLISSAYWCDACTHQIPLPPPRCDGLFLEGQIPETIAQHAMPHTGCLTIDSTTRVVYCSLLLKVSECYGCAMQYHAQDPCHWHTEKNPKGCCQHDPSINIHWVSVQLEKALAEQICYGCFIHDPLVEKSHYVTTVNKYGCRELEVEPLKASASKPLPPSVTTIRIVYPE